MHLFVTYFFHDKDSRYLPLLRAWFAAYRASGCEFPVAILTDTKTVALHGDPGREFGVSCLLPNPQPFHDLCRPGNHFDHKSALICAALPSLPAGAVVMDADALIARDPSNALEAYASEPFAMVPDSGKRTVPCFGKGGVVRIPEHSSSVMVFGDPSPVWREALAADYRMAWKELAIRDTEIPAWLDAIREQRAWSLVLQWSEGTLMEPALNWSPKHWGENPRAFINHHHGASKWTVAANIQPRESRAAND